MNNFNKSTISAMLLGTMLIPAACYAEADQRYIVKFKSGQKAFTTSAINIEGGAVKRNLDKHQMIAANLSEKAVAKLRNRTDVEWIEVDPKRYLLMESVPYGISMVQADQVPDLDTGEMTVCIMDTGYSLGHEDLPTENVTGSDGYDEFDSGNWFEDGHGHGTHVSGTITAVGNNDIGVVGVNAASNIKIHMVKVFDSTGAWAYGSDLIAGIDQCAEAGAKVISMSLGGGAASVAEEEAFNNATANGILSIAAAGNDGNSALSYPASYDTVMSVAAVDSSGAVASFSQFNSQVEIAAPGVDVESTWTDNSYATISGTSMATPHVAGVAALVWNHYPECSNSQIRQAMNKSAEDRGSVLRDDSYGNGIVKAKSMFDILADGCDVGEIEPPPPPVIIALEKGVTVDGLSASTGEGLLFSIDMPEGSTDLTITITGSTSGDADLHVRFGEIVDTTTYDCRPFSGSSNETCTFETPQVGTYYALIQAFSGYEEVSIVADYAGDITPPPPPPTDSTELIKGEMLTDMEGFADDETRFFMDVPAGASNLSFVMSSDAGATGDADLYVKFGSEPTTTDYDCRPFLASSRETCNMDPAQEGTYHVLIRGNTDYVTVSLVGDYDTDTTPPPPPPTDSTELIKGEMLVDMEGSAGDETRFFMDVPADASNLTFTMASDAGATGDADLYVKFGSEPTVDDYDCRPFLASSRETCMFDAPSEGTYHLLIRGATNYVTVSLVGDYDVDTTPPPPEYPIDLTIDTEVRTQGGMVTLHWNGATTEGVKIFRNGVKIKRTRNDGELIDRIRNASGDYTYQICDDSEELCSAQVTVTF